MDFGKGLLRAEHRHKAGIASGPTSNRRSRTGKPGSCAKPAAGDAPFTVQGIEGEPPAQDTGCKAGARWPVVTAGKDRQPSLHDQITQRMHKAQQVDVHAPPCVAILPQPHNLAG